MTKFEIFFGTCCGTNSIHADEKANEWLKDHPNIEIVYTHYQQARMGDHSICIAYKEADNGTE